MQGYKKSMLSLAITGVLSGMVATPVFANTVINQGEAVYGNPALDIEQAETVTNNVLSMA